MRPWLPAALVVLAIGLAGCRPPAAAPPAAPASQGPAPQGGATAAPTAPPRMHLRLGINAVSASIAPIWLAKDTGIFDRYGFDVELITLQSSSQVAKVMASGEIPVAISAAPGVIDAVLAGDDQVLISGFQNDMNFWVYSRP